MDRPPSDPLLAGGSFGAALSYGPNNPLAVRIREIRAQLGIGRKEFAGRVGVKVERVCELERGGRNLSIKSALAWARKLGPELDDHALAVAAYETHVARVNASTLRPIRPLVHELISSRPFVQRGGWR